ncbi:extensin precursor [Iris pallida]|uniref:Extensin n=1 Tax=Iris pallida TaxID=29817 RepID=A0AAX6G508_IRIPA|nr:extensin precursor [Iris pallida]
MCRLQPRWGRAVARDRRRPIAADLNRHGVHDAGEWLRRRQRVQGLGFFPFFSSLLVFVVVVGVGDDCCGDSRREGRGCILVVIYS